MAKAEAIYADPSALLKLYLNEPDSRVMARWRTKIGGALPITHHGRLELVNGIGLAAFRGLISEDVRRAALAALDDDFRMGRYAEADLLWRAALRRAVELSRTLTPTLGSRSLDILHVASALVLKLDVFLTFDSRQAKLARAVGLKLLAPR